MPATRFPVMALPKARPGACYITQRSSESAGPYVDTGMNIQGYGAVILSRGVVEEMRNNILAFMPPSDDEVERAQEIADAEQRGFDRAMELVKEKIGAYTDSLLADFGPDLPPVDDSDPEFHVPDDLEGSGSEEPGKPADNSDAGNTDAASGSEIDRGVSGDSSDSKISL